MLLEVRLMVQVERRKNIGKKRTSGTLVSILFPDSGGGFIGSVYFVIIHQIVHL